LTSAVWRISLTAMGASPPAAVADLVERFSRDRKVFLSFNPPIRHSDFVIRNSVGESLGWDVSNKAGLTEVFKPVIHEESIKIAGATKAQADGSQLAAHGPRPSNSGPSAVSRKPMADPNGQVYEQFLGKVIRLTPSHQAKVEEKPEVRKAGGVCYTPICLVDIHSPCSSIALF